MVLDLANRFRTEQDIDCEIDQHFLPAYPKEGWMKWMRDQIAQADYVLMVCTPIYRDRYERNVKVGGNGVAFEGLIISERLYEEYFKCLKFVPVICDGGSLDHVTHELRGCNLYSIPSDFQTIADLIKGKQYNPIPPLSETIISQPQIQSNTDSSSSSNTSTTHLTQREAELVYLDRLLSKSKAHFVNNNYITLSGDFQADRHRIPVPDAFKPTSFRHYGHLKDEETRQASGDSTHCDDLLTAFEQYKHLVVLGEPGAGKTFSLWKIASESAAKAVTNESQPIPVMIPLNKWTATDHSLKAFILDQMGELTPYFDNLCQQQRLLPLLDALNEIPFDQREEKLPQVKVWIAQEFPSLLLSCRERDYAGLLVQELDRLDIEPLDPPRVHTFLHKYFEYFEYLQQGNPKGTEAAEQLFWQLAGGESMKQAWKDWQDEQPVWKVRLHSAFGQSRFYRSNKEQITDIPKRIHHLWKPYNQPSWENFWQKEKPVDWYWEQRGNHPARAHFFNDSRCLMKLAKNPYLLNLIIYIYRKNQKLPESRYQLFDSFVSDLLQREVEGQYKAQVKAQLPDPQVLLENLQRLAWQLQGQTKEDEARTTLTRKKVIDSQTMTLDQLKFAAAASLLELTNETVRFSHQLLQEYFTAQSFTGQISKGLKAYDLWQPKSWWQPNGWEEASKLAADYETEPRYFLRWLAQGNPKLAVEIARDHNLLDQKESIFASYQATWQAAITDVDNYPNPHERHAISTVLAWLDWDMRSGVGLDESGLPDIHWLEVPEGEFIYGEKSGDQKTISLEAFEISQFPVTNRQFQAFVDTGGYDNEQWWEGLKKPDELPNHQWTESNRPVESVDWCEAMAFCRWLSVQVNKDIRLPTEQQWEKAARGTQGNKYPWGDVYISGYANINETWGHDKANEFDLDETCAVGLYPQAKSPYKAMDMTGNVWEWCLNKHRETTAVTDDLPDSGRVVRGRSWINGKRYCYASYRSLRHPWLRSDRQGFRLVCCLYTTSNH